MLVLLGGVGLWDLQWGPGRFFRWRTGPNLVDMFWGDGNGSAVRVCTVCVAMFFNSRGRDAFSWGSLLVRCGDGDGDVDVDMCGHEDACTVLSYAVHSQGKKRTASRFHVGDRLSSGFVEKDIYIHTRASSSGINIARKIRISYYKHNPAIKPHRSHRLAPHCPSPPASPLPYSSASLSLTTLSAH